MAASRPDALYLHLHLRNFPSGWKRQDKDEQPNKLLEAYNSLPKDAMPEEPGATLVDEAETEAGAGAATEETSHSISAETAGASRESKDKA